jgi:hypothetical protein
MQEKDNAGATNFKKAKRNLDDEDYRTADMRDASSRRRTRLLKLAYRHKRWH